MALSCPRMHLRRLWCCAAGCSCAARLSAQRGVQTEAVGRAAWGLACCGSPWLSIWLEGGLAGWGRGLSARWLRGASQGDKALQQQSKDEIAKLLKLKQELGDAEER